MAALRTFADTDADDVACGVSKGRRGLIVEGGEQSLAY